MLIRERNADTTPVNCGTFLSHSEFNDIDKGYALICEAEKNASDTSSILKYPVFFTVLTSVEGQDPLMRVAAVRHTETMNRKFANSRIRFVLGGYSTLYSPKLESLEVDEETELVESAREPRAINIYVLNNIRQGRRLLNGYTYIDRKKNFIMITRDAIANGTTLSHEMGHFFYPYHTHGKFEELLTDELVERSDCSCHGDDVCDTPEDPKLLGKTDGQCRYIGNDKDREDKVYRPDPYNLMSYAHSAGEISPQVKMQE